MLCYDPKCIVVVVYEVSIDIDSNIFSLGKHIFIKLKEKAVLGLDCWFSMQRERMQKSISKCLQHPPGPNNSTLQYYRSIHLVRLVPFPKEGVRQNTLQGDLLIRETRESFPVWNCICF